MNDPVSDALDVLFRAAGDDLEGFMGTPRRDPVSREAQEAAALSLVELAAAQGLDTSVDAAIAEAKGQAFDALWHVNANGALKTSGARIDLLAFMESVCGRPIALDPEG